VAVAVASAGPYTNLHLPQAHNHASTPPLSFLQARYHSRCPTNSIKALNSLTTRATKQQQLSIAKPATPSLLGE